MNTDGIILLAKLPGLTSFKTLNSVKKGLGTTKVGHTGTLDSFAQGLLVVCTGRLTRLAGNITEFNKTYNAIIKFGEETDTLEYTGNVIKTTSLPTVEKLNQAIKEHTGTILQAPPSFSAIHVDGQRSSDLMRSGIQTELPKREVTVFSAELIDKKLNADGLVEYAQINFSVSKGTYIRSLARDIGNFCGSSAHLIGLYRTSIGNFNIDDAAGFNLLPAFTIDSAIKIMEEQKILISQEQARIKYNREHNIRPEKYVPDQAELDFQEEIRNKKQDFHEDAAILCGFGIIHLLNKEAAIDFENGRPIRSKNFDTNLHTLPCNSITAVFTAEKKFAGLIEKDQTGKIRYKLVIN